MSTLFKTTRIKDLELPNRFVRSATWEGLAGNNGTSTPELVDRMVALAHGKVGLIITGHVFVSRVGQATRRQLGIDQDECIEGLRQMTTAVHREGGRIMIQLAHGGLRANAQLTGMTPLGPSTGQGLTEPPGREMTAEEIGQAVIAFGLAARRAMEAGFDGVQIHGAHGYLLSQFLSPRFNRREDEYGGKIENRARILVEVLQEIRRVVGRYFPIFIKINCEDFLEGGLCREDAIQAGVMLDRAGMDAIEISGGTIFSGRKLPFRKEITFERDQAYFRHAARSFKSAIEARVILVGGIRSYLLAERLMDEGYADYISMSRPFIREPHLVARWQAGDLRKATCISCNGCLGAAGSGEGIYCVQDRKTKNEVDAIIGAYRTQ
jgi:2,4-dienoyl-CoA reductase-like NADH-dependent reductase (Old Yellow Enzyme family)